MTEETQKSRMDSLIGIVKAFLRIDPMIALIALLIIFPLSIPIINAILGSKTEIVITFVIFISGITMFVYIPLIIVRGWRDKEKDLTENRKEAINKELASRLEDKKQARERSDQVVQAKIEVLQAQTKAIIENIPNFERILLQQEAEKIRESLGLELTDETQMFTRLSLVIESFEGIIKKFDNLESLVPGLQQTMEDIKKKFLEEEVEDDSVPENPIAMYSKKELVEQVLSMAEMIGELEQKLAEAEAESEIANKEIKIPEDLPSDFFKEVTHHPMDDVDLPLTTITGLTEEEPKQSIPDNLKIHEFSVTPEPKEDESELKQALKVVENLEESEPIEEKEDKHLSYWQCYYCGNKNPLKVPRCKKCSKGKKSVV